MKRHRGSLSATSIDQDASARSGGHPAMIGRFLIEERIGRGGMSDVYRAFDPQLNRDVALKVLSPALGRNPEFTERFIRESRAAARLNHPHVVPIFEAGNDGDTLFIAMQLVRGCDLKTHIERHGPLSLEVLLSVIVQASDALDHAHQKGLLHRDVKPANLLLEERESGLHVFLTDFGLTKSLGTDSRITHTGELVGSVHYVSPEHLEGRQLDTRTDVYSLGCVVYECLTGHPPFERDTDMAVLWAHLNAEAPAVSKIRKRVPHVVDRVVRRAMAKAPEERFSTCSALAGSLGSAIEGIALDLPVHAKTPSIPLLERLRGLTGVVTASLLLAGSVFMLIHDWTPDFKGVSQSQGAEDLGDEADRRRTGRVALDNQKSSRRLQGRDSDGRSSDRGPIRTVFNREGRQNLGGSGLAGTDRKPSSDGDALLLTRTERMPYDVRSADCGSDGPSPTGCAQFTLGANERFIDVLVAEQTEFDVGGYIVQDYDADDNWDGQWIQFCNETSGAVEVRPGARIAILFDEQGCNNNSHPTIGTIVTRVFGSPT